jgi:D-lactate dehydrogenase (cytochrome)
VSDLAAALLALVHDEHRVNAGESALDQHAADFTYHRPHRPDVVVYPQTTEEVARVLAFANERGVPVTPFGAGTSLEGGVIPVHGGISLDLSRMDAVLEVAPADLQARVQAGCTRGALAQAAGQHGLFFPVDPGADATLGGMAATNASGTTTVRYGGMRAQVLSLEAVLADGSVVKTGSRAVKSSAGYNLTSLLVGSEGTLAVITELTLKLYGIPDHTIAVRAAFPDLEAAVATAVGIIGTGIAVDRCEFLDAATIRAVNAFKETAFAEQPSLFIEVSGSEAGVAGDLDAVREIADAEGALTFEFERDADARARLWEARHHAAFAVAASAPGAASRPMSTDVAVPLSQLAGAVTFAREAIERQGFHAAILGHVGDGNFHVAFMFDPDDEEQVTSVRAFNSDLVDYALERGGTCTGEHGIGIGKIPFLERQHADLLPLMRGIKHVFDPKGILNPGKVLPG